MKRQYNVEFHNPVSFPEEGFYIKITFEHGDGHGTTYETIGPYYEDDYDKADEFIDFLEFIVGGSTSLRMMNRSYLNAFPDFEKYISNMYEDWEQNENNKCRSCQNPNNHLNCITCGHYNKFKFDWHGDHSCDYEDQAYFSCYKVYYISGLGQEIPVRLVEVGSE